MRIDENELCAEIGKRLKYARMSCHLTQEQLAEKAYVSSKYISDIETGKVNPSCVIMYSLISALHISADFIFSAAPKEDLLFQRYLSYYRACLPEKREVLVQTVEFIQEKLLAGDE